MGKHKCFIIGWPIHGKPDCILYNGYVFARVLERRRLVLGIRVAFNPVAPFAARRASALIRAPITNTHRAAPRSSAAVSAIITRAAGATPVAAARIGAKLCIAFRATERADAASCAFGLIATRSTGWKVAPNQTGPGQTPCCSSAGHAAASRIPFTNA